MAGGSADGVGHRDRLRDRFDRCGLSAFAPHEILEFLLIHAIPRRDVKPIAKALLRRYGSLRGVLDSDVTALQAVNGIGRSAASFLTLIRAVALVYLYERIFPDSAGRAECWKGLQEFWREKLRGERMECLEIAYLDASNSLQPEGVRRLCEGVVDQVMVPARELIREVLDRRCAAIVLCHNHPNGDGLPSEHDERITRSIGQYLQPLSVKLLDHLVLANDRFFSIREQRHI